MKKFPAGFAVWIVITVAAIVLAIIGAAGWYVSSHSRASLPATVSGTAGESSTSTSSYPTISGSAATSTPAVQPRDNSATTSCAEFANLKQGETDATTNGQVSALQAFVGISPTTGYYGAQTSIAYQNKCGNLGNASPTSVLGMSKYSDFSFGFSFWYPSGWTVQQLVSSNDSYDPGVDYLAVNDSNGNRMFTLFEDNGKRINDGYYENLGSFAYYYFDSTKDEWVYVVGNTSGTTTDEAAEISNNTMGGLHIFTWGSSNPSEHVTIPLSANKFVDVGGNGDDMVPLAKTITATDPAVAIPVSTAQQTADIEAEAKAYGVSAVNTSTSMQTYTNSQYGFSLQYQSGLQVDTGSPNYSPGVPVMDYGATAVSISVERHGSTTGDINITVSTNASDVSQCVSAKWTEAGPPETSTTTIDGIAFLHYDAGSPAAGLFSNDDIYKTLHGNTCYVIDEQWNGIESSHLDQSDAMQNDADIEQVSAELDSIAQSFRFTN